MEKNVIIAFALSLLIIIVFTSLQQQQPGESPEPATSRERLLPDPETSEAEISPAREGVPVSREPSGEEVVVETDLYRAVFDPIGARLVSFGLKDFRRKNEDYLETLAREMHYPFEISGWENVLFQPDRQSLGLGKEKAETEGSISFRAIQNGRMIEKKFTFSNDRYGFNFEVRAENGTEESVTLAAFSQKLSRERHQTEEVLVGDNREVRRIASGSMRAETKSFHGPDFIARHGRYVLTFLEPEEKPLPVNIVSDSEGNVSGFYLLDVSGESTYRGRFYSGPSDHGILRREAPGIALRLPSGPMVVLGRFILRILSAIYRLVPNWGVAIILLTIVFKIIFFPLTRSGLRAMKTMQKIQPMLKDIQQKHRNNPEALKKEMFSLYSHHKVNPMGGCLPMLLQIPVFIGVFVMLRSAIVLRGAHFLLWIQDLSMPDRLFSFPAAWNLPDAYGSFNLLPFLMGGTMFLQQKFSGQASSGAMKPEQQKMMLYLLPVMMTVFLYGLPSGLILYWTTTNVISIAENRIATRHIH